MELDGIRDLIFSDRYALKEPDRSKLEVGDKVVVVVSTEGEWEQRSVAKVLDVDHKEKKALLKLADTEEEITRPFSVIDKCLETEPSQMWDRMAKWLPIKTEEPELVEKYQKEYRWLLDDFRFLPGGRINASLGSEELKNLTNSVPDEFNGFASTLMNCFAVDMKPEDAKFGRDSRESIMDTMKKLVSIQSLGGGVGIPLSALRPNNAYIQGVNGRSSGAVSWGSLYSEATSKISAGGSRRGALLLGIHCHHPDVVEFIFSKVRKSEISAIKEKWQTKFPKANFVAHGIENANISVFITDEFMEAVKNDDDWDLVFPDYELAGKEIYNRDWDGDIKSWRKKNLPIKVYDTVKARDLWDCICESAWMSAEPGIIFIDRMNNEHNGWYYSRIIGTNPCGEIPLPDSGVCLLGHLNLPMFVNGTIGEGKINWEELKKAIRLGVRFLDDVADYNPYHDPRIKETQMRDRRIGLGTLGLGEALIRMGVSYGEKSVPVVEEIYKFIAIEAYKASIDLAEEKGSFPAFRYDKYVQSGFMKRLFPELPREYQKKLSKNGIRNVCLLTAAPTGSGGTMVGTSTGIEPYFAFSYWRSGRLGTREIKERIVQQYLEENNINEDVILPDYFVTAGDITPEDHIMVQVTIQKWLDQSISKTNNLPESASIADVQRLYELAHAYGAKGTTIYRSGSRDSQVLSIKNEDEQEVNTIPDVTSIELKPTHRPNVVYGRTEKISMPDGKLYITTNSTDEDGVVEVFIHGGEGNTEISALCNYIGRLVSVMRKYNVPLREIVSQGNKVPGGIPFWYKGELDEKGHLLKNIPCTISHVLARYEENPVRTNVGTSGAKCPSCKEPLRLEEGCSHCPSCGYSQCG